MAAWRVFTRMLWEALAGMQRLRIVLRSISFERYTIILLSPPLSFSLSLSFSLCLSSPLSLLSLFLSLFVSLFSLFFYLSLTLFERSVNQTNDIAVKLRYKLSFIIELQANVVFFIKKA